MNNKLYEGVGAGAGEFGQLPYLDGILENYCSGQFFKRQYKISGKQAYQQVIAGDQHALEMFHAFGTHVGETIKIIAHCIAPQAIILGGTISSNYDLFKASMWESIHTFPYGKVVDDLVVEATETPLITVLGAASLTF